MKGFFSRKEKNDSSPSEGTPRTPNNDTKMSKQDRIDLLETLASKQENMRCVDCNRGPVSTLSTTLGCLLCDSCGEIHKSLPENVSIVVSITNGALHERNAWVNHPMAPDILNYFAGRGNQATNQRWEAGLLSVSDPSTKLSNFDSAKQFVEEKYVLKEYIKEEVWEVKLGERNEKKSKKQKKKYLVVDENEKKVMIYPQDPRVQQEEVIAEVVINLEEVTLQYDPKSENRYSFTLCGQKGATTIVDCLNQVTVFDVMFTIHRTCQNVMESSAFHLGKWLDRIGFQGAIQANDLTKVKEYCQDDEKYAMVRNDRNGTPLHSALQHGQLELAMLLLEYVTDVEFRNTSGATPLHYFFGRKVEDLDLSMKFLNTSTKKFPNIDWNALNNGGASYLHFAVQVNSSQLAMWLVEKGANPDHANDRGFTPLLTAVWQNQVDVVKLMLDKKADIFVKTKQGKSALQLAEEKNHKEMYEMLFEIWETRRIQNQTNVINEIITTESDYIDRLSILVGLYKKLMVNELHLSEKAVKALFSNIDDIYKAAQQFYKDLEPVKNKSPEKKDIGACFVRNLSYFQKYIPYCTNQSISMKSMDIALSHPRIAKVVQEREKRNKEKLRSEKLDGFLIKPLQRITRFPLLLRELQRYTPETHEDCAALKEAANHLAEIVGKANEAKRARDHIDEIMEVLGKQGVQWSLTSRLVGEGKCAVAGLDSKLDSSKWFLFTDVFFVVKEGKGNVKYKITNLAILSSLPLLWEVSGKEATKLSRFGFSIVLPDRTDVKTTICFRDKEQRDQLMHDIAIYIMEFMNENEKKVLQASVKKLGLGLGDKKEVVGEDKERPIFFEELFQEGKEPKGGENDDIVKKEREKISFDSKLLRRVGLEKDDGVFDKLMKGQRGHDLDRRGMFLAIKNKDVGQVTSFLEQSSDFCHIKEKDLSPLHVACQTGNLEIVQLLIDHGSDLNQKDKKGNTPFHFFFGVRFEVLMGAEKLLNGLSEAIDEGFLDFDTPNNIGNTCLHSAVEGAGAGQMVPWLLRKGKSDPNAQNKNDETPLLMAVRARNERAVGALLGGGGDVWVRSGGGESVVVVAHELEDDKIWALILRRLNDRNWKKPPLPKKGKPRHTRNNSNRMSSMRHVRAMAGIPSSSSSSHSSPGPHPSWSRNSLGPGVVGAGGGKGAPSRKLVEEARLSLFVTDENKLSIPGGKGGGGGGGGEVKKRPQSTMMGKVPIEELEDDFNPSDKYHSYNAIRIHREELEKSALESYLSDKDFVEVFGLPREEFMAKPMWKRTILKKDVDLF